LVAIKKDNKIGRGTGGKKAKRRAEEREEKR
jgi:hypothetical protein